VFASRDKKDNTKNTSETNPLSLAHRTIIVDILKTSRQARRRDFAAGWAKNHKGGHIFQLKYWMFAARGQTGNMGAPLPPADGPASRQAVLASNATKSAIVKCKTDHWCRRRECKCTPKTSDLVKIWGKSLKNQAVEIWAKCLNTFAKTLYVL